MGNKEILFQKLTFAGLCVLLLGIFTSVSFSALSHILLVVPGFYFLYLEIKNKKFSPPGHWWALLVLMVICWLSVASNWLEIERPIKHIFKTKYFLVALVSYFSFKNLRENFLNEKRAALLIKLFLLATTIATASGLIGLWSGFNPLKFKDACHATRACGLYGMYMTYGYGISMFMVLISGAIVYRNRLRLPVSSVWLYTAFGVNLVGLVFSFARGGWLGFLGAIPFLFLKNQKKRFFIFVGGSLILLSGAFFSSTQVQNMFLKRQGSNEQRLDFFRTAFRAFQEKPMLGYGYKNFEANSKKIKKRYGIGNQHFQGHAHNNALEHLASTGLLGFLAFIVFCLLWLKNTYREPVVFAFVVSFLISGLFQYTFGDGENLFLILGIFSLF